MRVLIVSGYFPPYFVIGAQRVRAFSKHLLDQGHEVRVLTAGGYDLPRTLSNPLPECAVIEVNFVDVNWPLEQARRILSSFSGDIFAGDEAFVDAPSQDGVAYRLANVWRTLTNVPDGHVGWIPGAMRAGKQLLLSWRPDVVFASALPFSTAVVAGQLAHRAYCPWAVEFRDLWYGNPYLPRPAWRAAIDRHIEARVLRSAGCMVTVSEPLARELRSRYAKPVEVVTNGFDIDEFPVGGGLGNPVRKKLTLYHGGTIYLGKRDPLPLFKALALVGELRRRVEVTFSGQDLRGIMHAARDEGVDDCVRIESFKSRAETISTLLATDIALLLLWNDPREEGIYSGKLFEYLGAQRPILMLGYENGVAGDLVRRLDAGFVANDPELIAFRLVGWIEEKERRGFLAPRDHPERMEYSIRGQFARQERLLRSLAEGVTRERISCAG